MKKSLCLFLALLVLGSVCIVSAHSVINEKRDQVELTESVVYGDPAAAEGLVLDLHVTCNRRLFWDTTRTFEENAKNETDFHFSLVQEHESYKYSYSGVSVDLGGNIGVSYGGDGVELSDDVLSGDFCGYEEIVKDVVSRAEPGVEYTETVFLSDYMDYYPLNFVIDLDAFAVAEDDSDGTSYYSVLDIQHEFPELHQWLCDYFRIPVDRNYAVTVTVLKNYEGKILDIDMMHGDGYWLNIMTGSVITEDACYFALSIEDPDGDPVDAGLIPGGFGIYRIPFVYEDVNGSGDEIKLADIRGLENVYSLPPGESPRELQLSADGEDILFATGGEHGFKITVLDAETSREKQKLDITDADWVTMYYYDGYMAACSNERLILIEKTPDGEYRRAIDTDISGDEALKNGISWRSSDMTWDGEKLAIAVSRYEEKEYYDSYSGETYRWSRETCGCWLSVYDATGLLYSSIIDSSLSTGTEYSNYNDMETRFVYYDPVEVVWK